MRRYKGWLIAGVLLAVAIGGGTWWWRLSPLEVTTARVGRGPAVEAVYATGLVEPTVQMPVAPRTGGRLVQWLVEEGAQVRRGQVLARLQATELDQTVQELGAREKLARIQLDRTQALVSEQFLSRAELDRVQAEVSAAEAATRRAQAQRDDMELRAPADGTVLRRDGEPGQVIAAGQTLYTLACCAPLRVTAEVDEEDIVRVRRGQRVLLRSEALPGRVFEAEVADITPKGDPVARSWRVRIRPREAAVLEAAGARAGMTMDANIVIARRDDVLLMPSRALTVPGLAPEKGASNASNAVATGAIEPASAASTSASASAASAPPPVTPSRKLQVWVVDARGALRRQPVTLGVAGGERSEVLAGLAEGDTLVVGAVEQGAGLREGRQVRAQPAAVSPVVVPAAAPR
ncbi:efflux RND transporter periplasmic adaptor subunit [Leptothrix discophora]|uniref:Efflux RND transporter periplasmic adaptor subunit n=1 Tax=Leptothrix discophora TaxID=89 RepID=A0ABT9G453_LEPDI|nr:efflux RND transporter periplasmic adaptor subunit [Leptothrix discophora]MDP4301265.1 efflux RND transporter periplasmic adaptor subunit [Leptothrix discophora]